MDFRSHLRSVRRRPGMYFVGPVSYDTITTYVFGIDEGASGALLTGFYEFLLLKLGEQDNLAWPGLVLRLAFGDTPPRPLSEEDEAKAIDFLFDLLDEFLAEIRGPHALRRLFHEYILWSQTQPGYIADLIRFNSSPPDAVLTVDEAAQALGITRRDVFDLIAEDKLTALRSGATVFLGKSDVEKGAQRKNIEKMVEHHGRVLVPGQIRVIVESADRDLDTLTTRVRVTEGTVPDDLDNPASLFRTEVGDGIELHRGAQIGPDELVFRTFGDCDVPANGSERTVQWWWIDGTQQMLVDAPEWRQDRVTEHGFCPLTFENLDVGDEAYTDGSGNWISVTGWERFVRDDLLRLQSG